MAEQKQPPRASLPSASPKTDVQAPIPIQIVAPAPESSQISFEFIIFNLKIISQVGKNEKLAIYENKLYIDRSYYFQGLRRFFSGDTRTGVATFISTLVKDSRTLCKTLKNGDKEKHKELLADLSRAENGVRNLETTYADDDVMVGSLRMIEKNIENTLSEN